MKIDTNKIIYIQEADTDEVTEISNHLLARNAEIYKELAK